MPEKALEKRKHPGNHCRKGIRSLASQRYILFFVFSIVILAAMWWDAWDLFAIVTGVVITIVVGMIGRVFYAAEDKHKITEDKIKQQNELLTNIISNIPNSVFWKNSELEFLGCNENFARDAGLKSTADVVGKTDYDFSWSSEQTDFYRKCDREVMSKGKPISNIEETQLQADGNQVTLLTSKVPLRDVDGNITGILGVYADITERKKIESALLESEEKYRILFEEAIDSIFVADAETGIIIDCNQAALKLVGREKSELIGQHQRILHPPELIKEGYTKTFKQHSQEKNGHIIETKVLTKNGDLKDVEIKANRFKLNNKKMIQGIFHDITARKKADMLLRESEERLRTMFEEAPMGIALIDSLTGHIYEVNPKFAEIAGQTREKMRTIDWMSITHPDDLQEDLDNMAMLNAGKITGFSMKKRYIRPDGSVVWINMTIAPMKEEAKTQNRHLCMIEDITDRRQTEQALQESEEQLRLKLDSILSPNVEIDDSELRNIFDAPSIQSLMEDFSSITNMCTAILDLQGNILVATGWQDICTKFHRANPESNQNCIKSDLFLTQNINPDEFVEYKCYNQMWDMATPLLIGGKHIGNVYVGQFIYEDEVVDVEKFAAQADKFGFDKEAYLQALESVPRISREKAKNVMQFMMKFSALISKLGYSNLMLAKNIGRQKIVEADLCWKTAFLEAQIESNLDGILVVNDQGQRILTNQRLLNMWKVPQDIIDQKGNEVLLQYVTTKTKDPDQFLDKVKYLYEHPNERSVDEIEFKDGTFFERYSSPVIGSNGQYFGRIWNFRDITDRKEAEQKLRYSNEFSQTILDSMHDVLAVINTDDYTIEKVNKAFLEMYQLNKDDLKGKTCYQITHGRLTPCDSIEDPCPMVETLNAGGYSTSEHIHYTADGKKLFVEVATSPIKDETGKIAQVLHISRDITQRKQIEEERAQMQAQLRQTQKMEAIGTLAGGIAHDFNNILAALIGYADLAIDDIPEGTVTYQNLEGVLISANRAAELVRQILTFSRKDEARLIAVNINTIITEALRMLRSSLPTTIEIKQNIDCKGKIMADETQIHQVLINLCTNAAHAMDENGGVLEVGLEDVQVEPDNIPGDGTLHPGSYVKLTIKDTGCGMSKEVQERIFEPFFTTKEVGKGTGMGLSVIHGIIENHNGAITVDSKPTEGSTFCIYFPCVEDREVIETKDSDVALGKGERVLFIDDEKFLVDMITQMLRRIGYEVIGKTDSIEALEVFQEDPDKFDLVITDSTMPKMTGVELAKKLMDIRPGIPIVLCTGFIDSIDSESVKALGIRELVIKPVNRGQISRIIREILDRKDSTVS